MHLICIDGEFDVLPNDVRHKGPWLVLQRGPLEALRAPYCLDIARQAFALMNRPVAGFDPEC